MYDYNPKEKFIPVFDDKGRLIGKIYLYHEKECRTEVEVRKYGKK